MFSNLVLRSLRPRHSAARKRKRTNSVSAPVDALEERKLLTIAFNFDYSLDTNNFFNTAARRNALERAGDLIASHLGDSLDAIIPDASNSWTANFTHPGTGNSTTQSNLSIGTDEYLVYVGGRDLGGTLGRGGFGGFNWNGSSEWGDTVTNRGQASNGTDFARWGGTLTFNDTEDWHFGETVEGLDSNEFDFTTVAMHELFHALGFATGHPSYDRFVSGTSFTGPRSVAEFDGSGNVPLSPDRAHWASNTLDSGQRTLIDPSINSGIRELPTFLDWAGLDDIGWDVTRPVNDWGDAPSDRYPTNSAQNGARHNTRTGLFLGVYGDGENNGQTSDDSDGYDDEDGIQFLDRLFSDDDARVDVTANRDAVINAWIDFNLDGDWADPGEHILDNVDVSAGLNRLTFDIPAGARSGTSYARFRLNSTGNLEPTGAASDGEVEDYEVQIVDGILAIDDTASVAPGGSTNIDVVANDILSDRAEVVSFTDPSRGTVTQNADGTVRFTADPGESGTTTFDYTVGLTQTKLSGDGAADQLGRATVTFEDTLIVAAPLDTTAAGEFTGSVRVYRRNGLDWDLVQTITATDEEAGDRFGFSVALDNDTLVIGSRSDDDDGLNSGSVYVYKRDDATSNFTFSQKLRASTGRARDQFGFAVDIENNFIVVGVRQDDENGTNSGSAEFFVRPDADSDFRFGSQILPDTVVRGDQFGNAVKLSGNRLFVGARRDNNVRTNAGAVYVFERSGDNWNLVQQILPSKPEDNGYFGFSIDVNGDRLVVGQPARERQSRTGRVFIHERNEGGTNNWGVTERIDPENANGANLFGFSVSFSGNRIAVGAPRMSSGSVVGGDVRVFDRNEGGTDNWGRTHLFHADDESGGDEFGFSTVIDGDRLFVGAPFEDAAGGNSGSVYFEDLRVDIGRVTIDIG